MNSIKIRHFCDDGVLLKSKLINAINSADMREGVEVCFLEAILQGIESRLTHAKNNRIPAKPSRSMVLTRTIIDSWPLGTELGNQISDWEKKYLEL